MIVAAALAPPTARTYLPALRRSAPPPPPPPLAARVKSDRAGPSAPPAVDGGRFGSSRGGGWPGACGGWGGRGGDWGLPGPPGVGLPGCGKGLGVGTGGALGGGSLTHVGTRPRRDPLLLPEVPT